MSRTAKILKSIKALVPLYKEAGEETTVFLRHVERKLEHDLDVSFASTSIRCFGANTLDKMASGVIAVIVGRFIDKIEWIKYGDRRYDLIVKLGEARKFAWFDGDLVKTSSFDHVTQESVLQSIGKYKGIFEQRRVRFDYPDLNADRPLPLPEIVEDCPLTAICHSIALKRFEPPFLEMDVHCGANFHLKSFTEDLATELGTHAHITKVLRKEHGPFTLDDAIPSYEVGWKRFQEADAFYKDRVREYSWKKRNELQEVRPRLGVRSLYR